MVDWIMFFHLAGYVIGLGASVVIECLGFVSRKDFEWTQVTIGAHYVTKPLIWVGSFLVLGSWVFLVWGEWFIGVNLVKSLLLMGMVLNGCFLSFWVSPRLGLIRGKRRLVDGGLQKGIIVSFLVSVVTWWGSFFMVFL